MFMLVFIALIVAIVFAMLGIACFTPASATVYGDDQKMHVETDAEIEMGDMSIQGDGMASSAITGNVSGAVSVDLSVDADADYGEAASCEFSASDAVTGVVTGDVDVNINPTLEAKVSI